jgi:hypothetical protein
MKHEKMYDGIYEMIRGFYLQYRIRPNVIYVGNKEMRDLKESVKLLNTHFPGYDGKPVTLFGMRLTEVYKESELSVGLVISEGNIYEN